LAAETDILEVEPAPMPSSTNILTLHRFERITEQWDGGLVKRHYIMNDVVWAVDGLFGDTDWHKLQLSSCSAAIKTTLRLPE
jgi:hypothetical protein